MYTYFSLSITIPFLESHVKFQQNYKILSSNNSMEI